MASRNTPVSDMTGKMKRRRKQIWRRRLRHALIVITVLGVLSGGTWLVGFSSVLASKKLKIEGTKTLAVDDVARVAAAPMGVPLIRIDTQEIEKRIAVLPQVKSVLVKRSWPSTVTVLVTERTPIFLAKMPKGMFLVDESGSAYLTVSEPPEGLQVATFEADPPVRLLHDIASVAQLLPEDLRGGVFTAASADKIQLQLKDGRIVFFGSAEDIELKLNVVKTLISQVKANIYDVSAPSRPVVR